MWSNTWRYRVVIPYGVRALDLKRETGTNVHVRAHVCDVYVCMYMVYFTTTNSNQWENYFLLHIITAELLPESITIAFTSLEMRMHKSESKPRG